MFSSGSVTEPDAREIVLLLTERESTSTLSAAVTVPSTRAAEIEMWSVTVIAIERPNAPVFSKPNELAVVSKALMFCAITLTSSPATVAPCRTSASANEPLRP